MISYKKQLVNPRKRLQFLLFLFATFYGVISHVSAQVHEPLTGPRLEAVERLVELGKVDGPPPGESAYIAKFTLLNPGTETVRIRRVRSNCGCSTHELLHDVLAPGESTELTIRLDPAQHLGPRRRSIFVESNDPQQPVLILTVTGIFPLHPIINLEILPSVWRLPPRLTRNMEIQTYFSLRNNDPERHLRVRKVQVPEGLAVLTKLPIRIRSNQTEKIYIGLAENADPEKISGRIVFETDHPNFPEIYARVQPPAALKPVHRPPGIKPAD